MFRNRHTDHVKEEIGFGRRGRHGSRGEGPFEPDPRSQNRGRRDERSGFERRERRGHHGGHGEGPSGSDPRSRHRGRRDERFGFERRERRGHHGARIGRGDVRAAMLLLLAEQPSHGYQIIQQVSERSGGLWQPSPGSVYPALQMLEDEGLVRVEQVEGRRVFHLTEAGRAYVEERRDELTAAWKAVVERVDDKGQELRELFHQVDNAFKQVTHEGTVAQVASARTLLVTTRRQLYRILAEDESTNADQP